MTESIHPARQPLDELQRLLRWETTRRSGPGGQHRNKVETAAIVTHVPSDVRAEASERRSQAENRRVALFRLRLNLALVLRYPAEAEPSELWQSRVKGGRIKASPQHDDYPALLSELLDHWEAEGREMGPVAGRLGVTPSQLVKLIKQEPRAWEWVNRLRGEAGLKPYR